MDHLLLVRFRIDKEKMNDFALWRQEMVSVNRNQPGFVDSSVLEPMDADGYYYLTLRFRSEKDAQNWINSEKRKIMLSSAEVSGLQHMDEHITSWSTGKKPSGGANPFKQVLLTFVAVYPLTGISHFGTEDFAIVRNRPRKFFWRHCHRTLHYAHDEFCDDAFHHETFREMDAQIKL